MTPSSRPGYLRSLAALLAAAAIGGCTGSSTGGSAASTATPSELSASSTAAPTTSPSGSLPPEAAAVQGGKYYAVFLAVAADVRDPALVNAQQKAKALGYDGGVGDINCTPGARAQLKLSPSGDYTAFSVLFATKGQAQELVDAYPDAVVGIAYVTAGCLD
ncbi:MAG: hypothetical protein JWP11_813 [Frankiales bacterium]|nr:hypothetical protein [Frankiales bacterium]